MAVSFEKVPIAHDERGLVLELLEAQAFCVQRNAHIVLSLSGVVRGNHYHMNGEETVTILGPAMVKYRENGRIYENMIPQNEAWRFVFPPGVSHAIRNLSSEPNIIVAFNTEEHDTDNPDTKSDQLMAP
jgi:dTDP-4-dehydrorhamnose 3,5-epimerase-like enzyme